MRAPSYAQHWTNIFQLKGTYGASAFFFNAHEGLIGTGHYQSGMPAQIYYTNDGGATWRLSQFANPNILGEVTDIYFRDRLHGWAAIREVYETGWSGIYRSTDGGETWTRIKQAGFPAGVRETSRGVFYTDRDDNPGVMFSSDTGKTWTHIATTVLALGIDFMDDANGFVTTQATSDLCPHLYTTDSGKTWRPIVTGTESWTPYGDPVSRNFFLASELDQLTFSTQTTIVRVPLTTWSESKIKDYGDSALTGGIAGSHICQSIIYVQGREPSTIAPGGIIRTMDAGATWKFIGGPNNINDKRFAVTGRGAVVIAFDNAGNVWRTTDGGDGTLSPSVLPFITLTPPADTVRTTICDSVKIPILLNYSACDSAQVASVFFLNDSLHELSAPGYDNDLRFFSTSKSDTLTILYRPAQPEIRRARVNLTIRQPDGYTEDTLISILLKAGPSPKSALLFSTTTAHDTIRFDSVSICSDAYQSVTMSNFGCGNITVDSMVMNGSPFSLASNVKPFALSPGNSRTFLIHFTPNSIGQDRGVLYVMNSTGLDSVILLGMGYSSGDAVSLSVMDSIRSSECDSAQFSITLRNIACKAFVIDSIVTSSPFYSRTAPIDSLQPRDDTVLNFTFIPNKIGNDTGSIHLAVSYDGTGRYDTTITVIGNGTSGKPAFSVSTASLNMGTVPVCSTVRDSLVIYSSGCADVSVNAALDLSNGFSLLRAPKPVLASPDSSLVIVGFQPNKSLGLKTINLIFTTSAGNDTVPVSITVVSGGGYIAYSISPNIQAYLCQSEPFSISLTNSLCDSVAIDSVKLGGVNKGDFSLDDTLPIKLGSNKQTTISGVFTPQDSLTRTATVSFTIHETDGTTHDSTITVSGQGIAIPPIQVALGVTSLNAGTGQTVTIPIIAKRGSMTNMSAFDLTLLMNTDLLTPFATNANGFFGNSTSTISISQASNGSLIDTVHIHFDRGADAVLPAGELCELMCGSYITSVTSTGITLHNVQFRDANGSDQCLASETVPDTNATFILNQVCGDTTIEQMLRTGSLVLNGIAPNPTTGVVELTFYVPQGYANDALLEIYNSLGVKLGERQVIFPVGVSGKETFDFDLNDPSSKSEGIRYLRVLSSSGVLTAKVILMEP